MVRNKSGVIGRSDPQNTQTCGSKRSREPEILPSSFSDGLAEGTVQPQSGGCAILLHKFFYGPWRLRRGGRGGIVQAPSKLSIQLGQYEFQSTIN
jgi:hypothetical protein